MLILVQPGVSVCLPADKLFFCIAAPFDVSPKCSVVSERLHAKELDEADRDNEVYITHRQTRQTNMHPGVPAGIPPCVARRRAAGLRGAVCVCLVRLQVTGHPGVSPCG